MLNDVDVIHTARRINAVNQIKMSFLRNGLTA